MVKMKLRVLTVAVVVLLGAWCPAGAGTNTEHPLVPCPPEVSAQCPAEDGADPVYISVPTDCTKFCVCSAGSAYEETCLPGLVWDEVLHVCNWPNEVDCGSRPIP